MAKWRNFTRCQIKLRRTPSDHALVYLADLLAAKAGIGGDDETPVEERIPAAADSLNIDPSTFDTMVESLMAVLQVSGD